MKNEFVSIKKASEITGISEQRLRRGCRNGQIPHVRAWNNKKAAYKININLFTKMLNDKTAVEQKGADELTELRVMLGNAGDDLKKARENYSQALDTITSLTNELKGVKDELAKKDLEVQGLRKIQHHNNGTFEQAVQILRLTNNLLDAIVASMAEGKP